MRGFHVDWLTLRDGPQMTATEVLQRRDERLRLLDPVVSRMQAEFQGPLIERSLRILERRSQPFWREGLDGPLPLPPPELGESELKVDYVTPIGQAQKSACWPSTAPSMESGDFVNCHRNPIALR